jgi:TIR domain
MGVRQLRARGQGPSAADFRDLESRGILVWWDDLLLPGDAFAAMIRSKLADAVCVVVVWSRNSVRSEFVLAEAATGYDLRTAEGMGRLLPVVLDEEANEDYPKVITARPAGNPQLSEAP